MKPINELRLEDTGIPIALAFRQIGYNIRANIDKDESSLLFQMRDFKEQLRFNVSTSKEDIIVDIWHYINTNTTTHICNMVQRRKEARNK